MKEVQRDYAELTRYEMIKSYKITDDWKNVASGVGIIQMSAL